MAITEQSEMRVLKMPSHGPHRRQSNDGVAELANPENEDSFSGWKLGVRRWASGSVEPTARREMGPIFNLRSSIFCFPALRGLRQRSSRKTRINFFRPTAQPAVGLLTCDV